MGKAPKAKAFYAVARRKQHTGAVYASWKEAQPHTTGVSGAQCKGCDTLSEVREYFKKHGIDMKDVTWAQGLEPHDLADTRDPRPPALPAPPAAPAAVPPPSSSQHLPIPPPAQPPPIPQLQPPAPAPPVAAQRAVSAPPRLLYTDSLRDDPPAPPAAHCLSPALVDALRALSPAEIPAVLSELAHVLAAREEPDQTHVLSQTGLAPGFLHLRNLVDGALLALGDADADVQPPTVL